MAREITPGTKDGWAVLHQFLDVDFKNITKEDASEIKAWLVQEYKADFGQSAAFHIFGHKGPLCLLHFRKDFSLIGDLERSFYGLSISQKLKVKDSYVSVVELGMYHTTKKAVENLEKEGFTRFSDEFYEKLESNLAHHRENLSERAFCEIPKMPYFCFYPMNKKRGEVNNWYRETIDKRAELMMEHGMTGRRYAGKIQQIISGSIGFDGWEWGVDLFANNPLDIKALIYEMRFDEVTSLYGEFGEFWFGKRIEDVSGWLCA
jgi:chlorite dismutase